MPLRFATIFRAQSAMGLREWTAWLLLALVLSLGASQIVRAQRGDEVDARPQYQPKGGMAFEQPGQNFPGSAFYYLDDTGSLERPTAAVLDSGAAGLGAGAGMVRGLVINGSPIDQGRALQCLTAAIYYEAAMEPDAGQQAVAQVVLNRVMHPSYPNTVCGVVYQGSERASGCQFTFSCDGAMARAPSPTYWARARRVAERALAGYVYRPVGTATHYHTTEVSPYWAPSLDFIGTIGAHRFYRWQGAAGRGLAFNARYLGGEPYPGPKPRAGLTLAGGVDPLDPLVLAKAYEAARLKAEADNAVVLEAQRLGRAAPSAGHGSSGSHVPAYAPDIAQRGGESAVRGSNLPDNSQVRPEYRNSGQWIRQPGT
ncbi:cell wall hydrolase [Blastomonas natatoria]|uniref:Cell wall hydrolase n=1 Tax=Blastomonas natatoria TaxID=34015 RepID=A0A2V3UTD9_9SPHN|nr:cell wall hydrolase [Blastomonas natatoria]PXW69494.1 cell wall hydrolase [Blastomonas natatoria]